MNYKKNYVKVLFRGIRIFINRIRLKNKNFTIISSNCIGGVIYKELNQKFMSPTINLYMLPSDFIKFVKNLKVYLSKELEFINDDKLEFPVAYLGDIKIYFMHYKTKKEAEEKWNIRKERINYNNIFIIMTDRDGCTNKDIEDFENLDYKNKVILTHQDMIQYKSSFYIKGFEEKSELGNIMEYKGITGRKYYDDFDFVKWLNKKNIKEKY